MEGGKENKGGNEGNKRGKLWREKEKVQGRGIHGNHSRRHLTKERRNEESQHERERINDVKKLTHENNMKKTSRKGEKVRKRTKSKE